MEDNNYGTKIQRGVENRKWYKPSRESIKKRSETVEKPINQYDLNGVFIKRWKCGDEIIRELNFKTKSHISNR